jgi:nickel-dependent lactate racemase
MRFGWYPGPEGEAFDVPDTVTRLRAASLTAPEGTGRLPPPSASTIYEEALAHPMGCPPLRDMAAGARSVLLLVDDATRGTPTREMLPFVARELAQGGVLDDRIQILTAQGTHRAMTHEELDGKIGSELLGRWPVHQQDWREPGAHREVGRTSEGMPVWVHRLVEESDLVVGIGHVGVHAIMGFSGGAKILLPGVCGAPTEEWTHWTANWIPQEDLLGVTESPIRLQIEEGAKMGGLTAVFNVVMDAEGAPRYAAFGDFVRAQRACAAVARELHRTEVASPSDIVITDSHPADRDFWQSAKGLYSATIAVKEGGTIIMASPNPEGIAANHPNLREIASLSLDDIRERVERGREKDVIGAAVAAYTARMRERSRIILVSSGVPADEAARLGFDWAGTVAEAIGKARLGAPRGATFLTMEHAGSLLPIVRGRNDRQVLAQEAAPRTLFRRP